MSKCLVTNLKASTNNEALSKYNILTIKTKKSGYPTADTQWLMLGTSENGPISINSNSVGLYKNGISGELYSYPLSIAASNIINTHFEDKDGVIEVSNKYNLIGIIVEENGVVRAREIYGLTGITSIKIMAFEEGEVDAIKITNALNKSAVSLCDINANFINKLNKNTVGEFASISEISNSFIKLFDGLGLNDLANNTNISQIIAPDLLAGDMSSLAKLTKLNAILFDGRFQNKGDIMDFITPWISAGRTSGKIHVLNLLSQVNITLNGSPISNQGGVSNDTYINWTSNGTVTFTVS